MKSISGIVRYVSDMDASVAFYDALGFDLKKRDAEVSAAYVNWFWLDLRLGDPAPGAGELLYAKVDSVDDVLTHLASIGVTAAGEPRSSSRSKRELAVADPDGYELVFFE
jgi:catechol 2,3-dioxygenase-like lactoylglutathione lyase family enzyme